MKNTLKKYTEQDLIQLISQRDIKGMDALYAQYGDYIYNLVYKIVKLDHAAEHVLQDTFLKAWNKIDSFSSKKAKFSTWIINIARNTAIDMLRSKHYKQSLKLISLEYIPMDRTKTPGLKIETLDIKDIVHKLDEKYRIVIDMVYFKGFTHSETAKRLQIPLGTVKSRVRRAFKDLRIVLES